MSSTKQNATEQSERRGSADLDGQYRPIGIGAVAAALSATRKQTEPAPSNSNERHFVEHESLAA
jgi:hypothetical protein